MDLLIALLIFWCYLIVGGVVLAALVVLAKIEPLDTGDTSDSGFLTVLFWPIVTVRMIARRLWRFRRVDAALEETRLTRHHVRKKKREKDSQ